MSDTAKPAELPHEAPETHHVLNRIVDRWEDVHARQLAAQLGA